MRPRIPLGNPFPVSCFHVSPPSVDRYNPLPAPPLEKFHGCRRACHRAAYTIRASCGSKLTSIAPVFSSLYSTFVQDLPPSVLRNTPRSVFGPNAWPSAATSTMSGLAGSTMTAPICRLSRSPAWLQLLPPSLDLYTPSPQVMFPRGAASPVPT